MSIPTFIETYTDVFPEGFCEHIITNFNCFYEEGLTLNRKQTDGVLPHIKNDNQYFVHNTTFFPEFNNRKVTDVFWEGIQTAYEDYSEKYSFLKDIEITSREIKLQKVPSGGGYHIWHAEQGNGTMNSRCLTFMVYLNTLPPEACGETEFLYQQQRIKPEANTLIFWPAAYTHPHRGNAVYGSTPKYIATGWFSCV